MDAKGTAHKNPTAGRYRPVFCQIWSDDKFPYLDDDAKLVWFHVYTCEASNAVGVFKASLPALAADLRWPLERYTKAFAELSETLRVEYDERFHVVRFPTFFNWNRPSNPNVLTGWFAAFEGVPPSPLKSQQFNALVDAAKGWGEAFEKVAERFAPSFTNQRPVNSEYKTSLPAALPRADGKGTSTKKTDPPPGKEKAAKYTTEDADMARRMLVAIRKIAPSTKGSKGWPDVIRLMRELDGLTHDQIWKMFEFVQRDGFWSTVILSPANLRDKWSKLEARQSRDSNQGGGLPSRPSETDYAGWRKLCDQYGLTQHERQSSQFDVWNLIKSRHAARAEEGAA